MTQRVPADLKARLVVARCYLNSLYEIRGVLDGAGLDQAAIRIAIAVGDLEGKPIDISGIAGCTGIPRSTVKRRVDELKGQGLVRLEVGGRTIVHCEPSEEWERMMAVIWDGVQKTCREIARLGAAGLLSNEMLDCLSNLDTFLV